MRIVLSQQPSADLIPEASADRQPGEWLLALVHAGPVALPVLGLIYYWLAVAARDSPGWARCRCWEPGDADRLLPLSPSSGAAWV